uniref:Uncharacterized protein n=1 Tax=Chenopodium quinoa TaxID=63459 RepID=A0A803N9Q4_CHEQI
MYVKSPPLSCTHVTDDATEAMSCTTSSKNHVQLPKLGYTPKLDFLKFDGSNPRIWIKKCCKYFVLCKIPDDKKVDLASLNMIDKAENWVSSYLANKSAVDWNDFVIDVTSRPFVRAFKPQSIAAAIEYARLQDEFVNANSQKQSKPYNTHTKFNQSPSVSQPLPALLPTPPLKPLPYPKINPKPFKPHKYVPVEVRDEKIATGLCYYCDAPYDRNRTCQFKEPQLFMVEIPGLDVVDAAVVELEDQDEPIGLDPQISLCALTGAQNYHTMRVIAKVQSTILHTLIDSGICKDFTWRIGKHEFSSNVMLIPLGSRDMVLGKQWLSTLGSISWNFKQLTMKLKLEQDEVELRGMPSHKLKIVKEGAAVRMMSGAA